jgi:hypothetical protein
MSKEPGLLPKIEILIFGLVFLGFLLWAVTKCNSTRREYRKRAEIEAEELRILDSIENASLNQIIPLDTSMKPVKKEVPVEEATSGLPILYVTFKGLNMRSGPGLNYKKVARLELFDEVYFLGEVTDSTEQIDLGEITTDKPWVKIKTLEGKEGWVYGAGVDYYKHEIKGVETD